MIALPPDTPDTIAQLAQRAAAHIQQRFGLTPDITDDTLPLLDAFTEAVVCEENRGEVPEPGHVVRHNMVELFAPSFGALFGITLASTFGADWRGPSAEPAKWRLEFRDFFLRINPAGLAAHAIVRAPLPEWPGTLQTAPSLTEHLEERLRLAPGVPEDQFFSLETAWESIQIAADYLRERAKKDGAIECSEAAYATILGQ
ncbi:MAG: hypothetical protein M0R76_11325 [Proteobacteria bacterium]|nr:hypothetical protein [Pseudomonadota bacterium]